MAKTNFKKLTGALMILLVSFALATTVHAQRKPRSDGSGGLVNLDFQDADIKDVVKTISEITGKNFILDDRVRGKITIISPTPVTTKEAYEAFLSALEIKNYTVVPGAGRTSKIVPLREVKSSAISTISDMETPYGDTFITRLVSIRYISASEIANSLKSLVSPNGTIQAYNPTNTLIITDSASNIRRLMKIIGKLDKEGSVEGIEVIPLKYASSQEVAQKLIQIFPQQKDGSLLVRTLALRRGQQEPAEAQTISKIIPDDRTNSIIVVANRQGLEKLLDIVKRLDIEVRSQEGKGKIHVHYLEHADAEELAATLSSLGGGGGRSSSRKTSRSSTPGSPVPSDGGSVGATTLQIFEGDIKIAPDIATNSLVITASGQDYEELKKVIAQLDIARPQVFVEGLIMEVNMNKTANLGVAGSIGGNVAGPSGNSTVGFGATQLGSLSSLALNPSSVTGLALGLRSREIPININGTTYNLPIYGAIFRANQDNKVFNIISTPNIMTTDNKEAEIVVGSVVPVLTQQQQSTSAATTSGSTAPIINSISREKVATTLRVTPQINESDFVTLDLFQEISEVDASAAQTYGPTTTTRSAKTTVVVQDGQTVVIGGLIKDAQSKSVSKVPILGDIPLLGLLFRNTTTVTDKINLMIFITPHIVHEPMDQQNISVMQNEKRRMFNNQNKVDEHPGVKGYGIDKGVDFNSVRPKKTRTTPSSPEVRPTPAPDANQDQTTTPPSNRTPDYKNDSESSPQDSGTVGRAKSRNINEFTQIEPARRRSTKPSDESFFKEEATAKDFDDSDYISQDIMTDSQESKPSRSTSGTKRESENPFVEIAPPSSNQ